MKVRQGEIRQDMQRNVQVRHDDAHAEKLNGRLDRWAGKVGDHHHQPSSKESLSTVPSSRLHVGNMSCVCMYPHLHEEREEGEEDLLISAATPDPRNLGRKFIGKRLIFGITRNAS